jgi:hypothetical protein
MAATLVLPGHVLGDAGPILVGMANTLVSPGHVLGDAGPIPEGLANTLVGIGCIFVGIGFSPIAFLAIHGGSGHLLVAMPRIYGEKSVQHDLVRKKCDIRRVGCDASPCDL